MRVVFRLAAVGLFSLLLITPSTSEPFTAIAVMSLIQVALQSGAKGGDVTQTALLAQGRILEAFNARVDQIEDALKSMQDELHQLRPYIRYAVDAGTEKNAIIEARGLAKTLQARLSLLQRADDKAAKQQYIREIRALLLELESRWNALADRSDFVVTALVPLMIIRINGIKVAWPEKEGAKQIADALKEYDERLAQMLNPKRPGSLTSTRMALEEAYERKGADIASEINGPKDPTLRQGVFPWFTLVAKEKVDLANFLPAYKRSWKRGVQLSSIDDPFADGLVTLKINAIRPESENVPHSYKVGSKDVTGIKGQDAFYEARDIRQHCRFVGYSKMQPDDEKPKPEECKAEKQTPGAAAVFNSQARAIVELRRLEGLAIAARILVVRWSSGQTQRFLMGAAESAEGARKTIDWLDDIYNQTKDLERNGAMEEAKRASWKAIEEYHTKVDNAIRASREAASSGDTQLMNLLKVSLEVYLAWDKAAAEQTQKSGKELLIATTKANLPKLSRVEQLIREVQHPIDNIAKAIGGGIIAAISNNANLPNYLSPNKLRLEEAIVLLNSLEPTSAAEFREELKRARFAEFSKNLTAAAPDRQALRKKVNELLKPYIEARVHEH
jgi:hypothetical protein